MTAIAWDGKEMCSDSLEAFNTGEVLGYTQKLFRLRSGGILGTAGDGDCREVIELFQDVETQKDLPSKKDMIKTGTNFEGLLWLPDRTMNYVSISWDADAKGYEAGISGVLGKMAVAGCGGPYALGVMKAGGTARDGIKAAVKSHIACGGAVQTMTLEVSKPKKRKPPKELKSPEEETIKKMEPVIVE